MHDPRPPSDRPSTRALTALAVTYAAAAGLHGVLAALTTTWWPGALAAVLAAVAVAFAVAAWRRGARRGSPGPRPAARHEDLAIPAPRRRDADPTRA